MNRKMTNQEAATFIIKSFIRNGELKSCANCSQMLSASTKCLKYNVVPPIEIILYSCGAGWEDDIPF
jgi:hypothetical protein